MESQNLQRPQEPSPTGLSVLVDPSSPTLDIVFVHGFTGHPERTWRHKQGSSNGNFKHDNDPESPSILRKIRGSRVYKPIYWPRDLLPTTVPDARILTYGYDTNIHHWAGSAINQSTAYDIAWDFLVSLEAARRSNTSRPLIFIAHSLGGIIVKEALRRSRRCETHQIHLRSIYNSSSGIVFFGTPHGGADPRGLVQHIIEWAIRGLGYKVNEQIVNALLPSSERLKELRDEFVPMARQRKWTVHSFQEQYGIKGLGGKKVVEDTASCLNDPTVEVTQHIANNHMEMCRFSSVDDVEYKKVIGAVNRIIEATKTLTEEQRKDLIVCLRFSQIDARHATIKIAHVNTCKWLLSSFEYQEWLDDNKISTHHGFLWIKGKPGAGKSTIMKYAYSNAESTMRDTIIISFFFNARGEQLEKSALGMYRSLLLQVLEKLPDLPIKLKPLQSRQSSHSHLWGIENIEIVKNMFRHVVESLGQRRLVCFIDALDECGEDDVQEMVTFFERLGQFAVSSRLRLRICFSSRHYPYITIEKGVCLVLENQGAHGQDIANYVRSELKAGRSKLADEIKDEILKRASGIFLWVVLVVWLLNKEFKDGRIYVLRKRLDEIPNGLDELFQEILLKDDQNIDEMILCLQWILYAKQPLRYEELYFAVMAGVAPEALAAWDHEETTKHDMERFVLSSSKGLAETTKSDPPTVQFIHESVRDFLLKGNGLNKLRPNLCSNFPGFSHERLNQCCQIYLRFDVSERLKSATTLPAASSWDAEKYRQLSAEKFPFLKYANRNVLCHADTASGYGISQTAFVENFNLRDWISLDNIFERDNIREHSSSCSLLYLFAERDLLGLLQIELQRVQNIDVKGELYGFPLNVALALKNESAVRALLTPNKSTRSNNNTPFHLYSSTDREYQELNTLVLQERIILGNWDDRTVLSYVAQAGHQVLTKILLETGKVDIDSKDNDHKTPLSWAAWAGREAVVKILLETSKVNVDSKDKYGQTPLSLAAWAGHEAVVKLLLETGKADVDSKDNSNKTPFSQAVRAGHETIVKILLETGKVDIDSKDNDNMTPLALAAWAGHKAIVKLLLETGKVDVDSKDNDNRTPLALAAWAGHKAIVKLLLETGKVDVNSKDKTYKTPLFWAAYTGHKAVVKILLETGKTDINSKDNHNMTPLSWAVWGGHEAVVKILLETGKFDVDSKDNDDMTPFSYAAQARRQAIVKLLLEYKANQSDRKHQASSHSL